MANDVAVRGNTALATGGANPWAEAARGVESGTYLKFNGNDGRWSFGQDDEDLPEGSRVVMDMESLAFGWICWVESSVEEEVLVAVLDGKPPAEHELTDYGPYDDDDGWREAASLSMVLESYGDDDQDEAVGSQLLWKTSTGGQVRQIRKLSGTYGRQFSQHPGEFPIVELDSESYAPRNKKHGKKKFSPMLKIVGWMTLAELEGLAGEPLDGGDDEPEEKEAAPKRGRGKADEDEAPKRGRGRGKADEDEDEDEQEEAPKRGRGRAKADDEDEQEEAPKRGRGRRAAADEDDGEDEQEEAPKRGRGRRAAADEDEQEEAPKRGRGRRAAADEDDSEDEQEEAPKRGRGRRAAADEDDGEDEQEEAPKRGRGRASGGNRRLRTFD